MYVLRVAESVNLRFLSRPKCLTFISLLLLKDSVFEVYLFPGFGRSGISRDVPGNEVVVGRGRGVFIKRSNDTSKHDGLDDS